MNKLHFFAFTNSLCFTLFISSQVSATTPAEMADLSLQELFALSTDDIDLLKESPWQLGFMYKQLKLDGYKRGSSNISDEEILFVPTAGPRTESNFPILPKVITQSVFIGSLSYKINDNSNVSVNIPYIKQSTDHISIVPGFSAFTLNSSGIGDLTVNYSNIFMYSENNQLSYSIGLSMPTGSIDEQGDTPRAPGDQQLPFTMQIGSGTWDIPAGLSYQNNANKFIWGANLLTKLRIGKNKRNYALGNRFALSIWAQRRVNQYLLPFTKLTYQNSGSIDGRDEETTVPGAFPYPAGITNPKFFGGKKIKVAMGSDVSWNEQNFTVEISIPVYQNLNGIQPKEDFDFSINWNANF